MFTKDGGGEGGKQMDHRPSSPCAGGRMEEGGIQFRSFVAALLAHEEAFTGKKK